MTNREQEAVVKEQFPDASPQMMAKLLAVLHRMWAKGFQEGLQRGSRSATEELH